jgi:hypothetical protein
VCELHGGRSWAAERRGFCQYLRYSIKKRREGGEGGRKGEGRGRGRRERRAARLRRRVQWYMGNQHSTNDLHCFVTLHTPTVALDAHDLLLLLAVEFQSAFPYSFYRRRRWGGVWRLRCGVDFVPRQISKYIEHQPGI